MKDKPDRIRPRFSKQAGIILKRRYQQRDLNNRVVETPGEMLWRVARTVAAADERFSSVRTRRETERAFYQAMAELDFLPNSPTLMNAGLDLGQLAACFVLPVEDSIESIFNAIRDTALIHKSGGGTGFDFSRLRPANDRVKSTHGISSGPISFMHVFDVATETIKQGGVRRGANMGLLSASHPDILTFASAKASSPDRFKNFNLSVSAPDAFMRAVQANEGWALINPHTDREVRRIPAREVFDQITRSAWECGDPGLVFIDRINQANTLPHLGRIEATNPCGEQPLFPYESCNLGSINLSNFVKRKKMDYARLGATVRLAVHFLDNVIEVNKYPLPQIEEMTLKNRKIGLGVMGLADMFIRLGIPYNSEEALGLADKIMFFIQNEARGASAALARRRGNFPAFAGSLFERQGVSHMRNATTTTIAPTGTLSMIAGCSSSIEPLFAVAFSREILDHEKFVEIHAGFRRLAKTGGFWSPALEQRLARNGSVLSDPDVPPDIKRLFVTTHDIDPQWHLRMQAAFQAYADNAVSKTINLPHEATPEDVADIYLAAYDMGLKGITVYRDGSRLEQVIRFGEEHDLLARKNGPCPECGRMEPRDRLCRPCENCGYSLC